jgi:excisionase family DNA binding protein
MTLECPITIYTAAQVATMLQVSTRTVERLVTQGRLPAVRMGRRWRITHAQLQAYLREESTTPPRCASRSTAARFRSFQLMRSSSSNV